MALNWVTSRSDQIIWLPMVIFIFDSDTKNVIDYIVIYAKGKPIIWNRLHAEFKAFFNTQRVPFEQIVIKRSDGTEIKAKDFSDKLRDQFVEEVIKKMKISNKFNDFVNKWDNLAQQAQRFGINVNGPPNSFNKPHDWVEAPNNWRISERQLNRLQGNARNQIENLMESVTNLWNEAAEEVLKDWEKQERVRRWRRT